MHKKGRPHNIILASILQKKKKQTKTIYSLMILPIGELTFYDNI